MSQHQRIAKHFLSLAIHNSRSNSIPGQRVKCLYQRFSPARYSTDSKIQVDNKPAPKTVRINNPKPDTRRGPERLRDKRKGDNSYKKLEQDHKSYLTSRRENPSSKSFNTRNDRKWTQSEDQEIIRLFNSGTPWKDIDYQLGRPLSSCYSRYYSELDPNLRVWNLPQGQPNPELIKRLVYLVEVEKQSFSSIDKRNLMEKPWETPTPYAPPEVLLAAGVKPTEKRSNKKVPFGQSQATNSKYGRLRPFNKLSLQKKYDDYKARIAKSSIMLNKKLLHRAIQRGVELYGENWKKVAVHADRLLDLWTPTKAKDPDSLLRDAINNSEVQEEGAKEPGTLIVEEREALRPQKVASIYRIIERHGVSWGLEDDVIMARKVLGFYQKDPNVLDILAKPYEGGVHDHHEEEEDQNHDVKDMQRFYWDEISVALGTHSPTQCKNRWDGLWNLHDDEKSAQSKSWHRFERYNFWMIWSHFYQKRVSSLESNDPSRGELYTLSEYDCLERISRDLSFSEDVSKWMRHRSAALCEKYFKSTINSVLRHNTTLNSHYQGQQQARTIEGPAENLTQSEDTTHNTPTDIVKSYTVKTLLDTIHSNAAVPILEKISKVNPETEESTRKDTHQPIVRPDWTKERIKTLYDIVLKEKLGVLKANFEIDWDKIANRLEKSLDTSGSSYQTATFFTGKHCQDTWEYLSSRAAAEAASTLNFQPQSGVKTTSSQESDFDLTKWTDHELRLLQQGIRKFGNAWVDIRAHFLPNRTTAELYQAWLSVSTPSQDETVGITSQSELVRARSQLSLQERVASMKIDRLSEPDYVGLLSALDKVGDKKTKEE